MDNLSVEIIDNERILSDKIHQKLITEIKLKLMSSGMKVTSPDESHAKMFLIVDAIKSNFAAHRIIIQLNVYENVITQRLDSIQTVAATYSDYSFFINNIIEQAVYDEVMDVMIIKFIEKYLSQNWKCYLRFGI